MCVVAALLQVACASTPADKANIPAAEPAEASVAKEQGQRKPQVRQSPDLIRLKVDGGLPIFEQHRSDEDALLASKLKLGIDDDLLRYQASWQLEPGNVFANSQPATATPGSPTHFASQRLGQNIDLRLPELAGAPLSLGLSTEFLNNWMVSGYSQSQRERANLDWSPGPATVNVQWAGAAAAFDASVALICNVESTIRLPTHEAGGHSEALRVSGRDCVIAADDTPYAGIEAQTWGLGYVWSRPQQESEAVLSMIDPSWTSGNEYGGVEPSYQLGLSHRRDFGPLSAKAFVSLRQSSIRETGRAAESAGDYVSTTETGWATNASLTWQLPDASLSANWAQGVDRLWFTPEFGQQSDRFGLALNLSRWIEGILPDASPQFAMKWNWSQVRLPGDEVTGNNSLTLDLALLF